MFKAFFALILNNVDDIQQYLSSTKDGKDTKNIRDTVEQARKIIGALNGI